MSAKCNQCQVLYINGVKTHETGCPEAYKDYKRECKECGNDFRPKSRFDDYCHRCKKLVYR